MRTVLQDLSYGLRMLARNRGFTIAAVLSLALGIALNTAIFTLVNTILLGSLPYRDADRLVELFSIAPEHLDQLNGASVPDFFAWKKRARSFEWMGGLSNSAVDFGAEENGLPAERIAGRIRNARAAGSPGRAAADGAPLHGIRRRGGSSGARHRDQPPALDAAIRRRQRHLEPDDSGEWRKYVDHRRDAARLSIHRREWRLSGAASAQSFSTARIGALPDRGRQAETGRHHAAGAERDGLPSPINWPANFRRATRITESPGPSVCSRSVKLCSEI